MALAYAVEGQLMAAGTYGQVDIYTMGKSVPSRILTGHQGNVNALVFSADGAWLFAAGGQPGLLGEVKQWRISDGTLVRTFFRTSRRDLFHGAFAGRENVGDGQLRPEN